MSSNHLPILIGLQTTATPSPARYRTYINFKQADWSEYGQEIERKLSSRHLPTDFQIDEKLFRATLLKAASHHILTGRHKLHTQQVFNQWKPPHRTVCVAIDLTTAFDTVSHDILISKIAGSSLPLAITRWLSCYLRGRQAASSFRGTKSSTRIVRTGVPKGSKLSPALFNYYIADMPSPNTPVKRVCYAYDITVWASGPKIPLVESMINIYLREINIYLKENSLLISAPTSTVTLFIPDKHQFQTHPDITLEDKHRTLERSPKILGVMMDPSLSLHKHCTYVSDRIDKRNNLLKALAGSSWGREKET